MTRNIMNSRYNKRAALAATAQDEIRDHHQEQKPYENGNQVSFPEPASETEVADYINAGASPTTLGQMLIAKQGQPAEVIHVDPSILEQTAAEGEVLSDVHVHTGTVIDPRTILRNMGSTGEIAEHSIQEGMDFAHETASRERNY